MRYNICKKLIALMAILCLVLTYVPAMADEPVLYAAPVSAGGERNGMVRVYLSSLNDPSKINITVSGSYSINGDTAKALKYGTS